MLKEFFFSSAKIQNYFDNRKFSFYIFDIYTIFIK